MATTLSVTSRSGGQAHSSSSDSLPGGPVGESFNERSHSIYLIFATDHAAGDRIMTDLYNAAADEFPRMREDARQRRARLAEQQAGIQSLFGDELELPTAPRRPRERLFVHTEPWQPFGSTDR